MKSKKSKKKQRQTPTEMSQELACHFGMEYTPERRASSLHHTVCVFYFHSKSEPIFAAQILLATIKFVLKKWSGIIQLGM